jgi:hypothetical protein
MVQTVVLLPRRMPSRRIENMKTVKPKIVRVGLSLLLFLSCSAVLNGFVPPSPCGAAFAREEGPGINKTSWPAFLQDPEKTEIRDWGRWRGYMPYESPVRAGIPAFLSVLHPHPEKYSGSPSLGVTVSPSPEAAANIIKLNKAANQDKKEGQQESKKNGGNGQDHDGNGNGNGKDPEWKAELQKLLDSLRQKLSEALKKLGRTFEDILKNDELFKDWLHHKHPKDKPFNKDQAKLIWEKIKSFGMKPRLDKGHEGRTWDVPHINVEGTAIHIPVDPDFKQP